MCVESVSVSPQTHIHLYIRITVSWWNGCFTDLMKRLTSPSIFWKHMAPLWRYILHVHVIDSFSTFLSCIHQRYLFRKDWGQVRVVHQSFWKGENFSMLRVQSKIWCQWQTPPRIPLNLFLAPTIVFHQHNQKILPFMWLEPWQRGSITKHLHFCVHFNQDSVTGWYWTCLISFM